MKNKLFLSAISILLLCSSFIVNNDELEIINVKAYGGYNFKIIGEESDAILNSFESNYKYSKKKDFIWKFKNISIPKLKNPVNIKIHQGRAGNTENRLQYFCTYKNEQDKKNRSNIKSTNEQSALVIYITKGNKHVIQSKEEIMAVKEFLISIK